MGSVSYALLFFLHTSNMWFYVILSILGSLGFGLFNLIIWAFISDIIDDHEVKTGVREDGTVVAVGDPNEGNSYMGYAHVNSLKDVVYISAGHDHTVAVDKYGKVHCIGSNEFGQCDLNGMTVN